MERALPNGWTITSDEEGVARVAGPSAAWEVVGTSQDAHDLFWTIWNAALHAAFSINGG